MIWNIPPPILWLFKIPKICLFLPLILIFSPTKKLTHNGLNLCGKLLHTVLVETVFSRNSSCELVTNAHIILIWEVAFVKTVDYTFLIISTMRFCSSPLRNSAFRYANLLTLVFDHFNLLSNLEEVDFSGPQPFLAMFSLPLVFSKSMVRMSYTHTYPYLRKRIFKISMEKSSLILNHSLKNTPLIHASNLLTPRSMK